MGRRGVVVWAPDPLKTGRGNPRPWLVLSGDALPCPDEECIAVAFAAQSHHPGSVTVPSEAWVRGEPDRQSHVLSRTVATLKDDIHVVGRQGSLTDEFTDRIASTTSSYLRQSDAASAGERRD